MVVDVGDKHQIEAIARQLAEVAGTGRLAWERAPGRSAFLTKLGEYGIVISQRLLSEGEGVGYTYALTVLNSKGDVVEDLLPSDLDDGAKRETLQKTLEAVHEEARRQTLGVDQALQDILTRLREKGS